jgi:hypothetical protein
MLMHLLRENRYILYFRMKKTGKVILAYPKTNVNN